MHFLKSEIIAIRIDHDGTNVQLVVSGRLVFSIPWQQALEVSKAFHKHAKLAEEHANADQIVHQEAALVRAGWPISLTGNPLLKKLAHNEAVWGWVRRYIPNNHRGTFFPPVVKQLPPKKE